MKATLVADKVTPLPIEGLVAALADGFSMALRSDPPAKCLSILTAQACLETGNGQKMHGYNLGNVKAAPDWEGLYAQYRCNEIIGGKVVWFDPPHAQTNFRAYATAAEGAKEYVEFLAIRERYRKAWSRAFNGDAAGFSHELRVAGYYTANEDSYTAGIVSIASRSLPACERILMSQHHALTAEDIANINALVLLTTAEAHWNHDRHEELQA